MKVTKKIKRLIVFTIGILSAVYIVSIRGRSRTSLIYLSPKVWNQDGRYNNSSLSGHLNDIPFDTKSIRYIPAETIMQNYHSMVIENAEGIDWNKFAYVFYATSPSRLLPIFINVKQLRKLKTRAQIQIICSFDINMRVKDPIENLRLTNMVKLLKERYASDFHVVEPIISKYDKDSRNWADSFTKLYAFSLVAFDRVIYVDADSVILKSMDQLFLLPPALLVIPLNYIEHKQTIKPEVIMSPDALDSIELPPNPFEYTLSIQDLYKKVIESETEFDSLYFWKLYAQLPSVELTLDAYPNMKLASYFMIIKPDITVFDWLMSAVKQKKPDEYDMEVVNTVWRLSDIINQNYYTPYNSLNETNSDNSKNKWLKQPVIPSLLILPHSPYGLLSGEFRHTLFEHSAYLAAPGDYGFLDKKFSSLSIQRAIKNGVNYKNIEEIIDDYFEVPYWDWAWRFDFEGTAEDITELANTEGNEITDDERKKNLDRNRISGIDEEDEIGTGMGVDKFGWNAINILKDASYIHWSDWPLDKPWGPSFTERVEEDDWLFDNIYSKSLEDCKLEMETLVESLDFESHSKIQHHLTHELQFAYRTCTESLDSWKKMYENYASLLKIATNELDLV